MIRLKAAGIRIPEDIAFAGFNNDPISKVVEPNLTTVNYSGYAIGEAAVTSLINHLKGISSIKTTNTIILRSDLIIRESSLKKQNFVINFFCDFYATDCNMKPKKDITIYDIAQKLDLSSATVSRGLQDHPAINKNTRKKIQETAKELGYRHNNFASNLRKQKTNTIGVIVHELNSNFITSVLAGIEKVTTEAGYDLIIAHSSESYEKEAANALNLFHKRVDGLIASLAFDTKGLDHYKLFEEKGIPVIFFDRVEEKSESTKVIIDNYKCGYQATHHLIEQGCKRIVMVTANLKRNVYAQRHKGYTDALFDNNIPYDKDICIDKGS